jgi:hypothetical protein
MARIKTDPAVLSARQRMRDNLKKATQKVHEQETLRAFEEVRWHQYRANRKQDDTTYNAVVYGISKLATAVVRSMGVSAPINLLVNNYTTAVTDFRNINIKVQRQKYDTSDFHQMRRLLAFVKGLVYHEAGHILYTTPFLKVRDAVSSQLLEQLGTGDGTATHRAWNMLEDQRMETAMVRRSGILHNYFQVVVLDHVAESWSPGVRHTNPWPLVAGRTYLPKQFLTTWKNEALWMCEEAGDTTLVSDITKVVSRYKRADNPNDMWTCIIEFTQLMKRWAAVTLTSTPPPTGADHLTYNFNEEGKQKAEDTLKKSAEPSDKDEQSDDDSAAAGGGDDDQQDEGDEEELPGQGGEEEGEEGEESSGQDDSKEPTESPSMRDADQQGSDSRGLSVSKDDIREHINELVDELSSDNEIKDFMASINDEMRASMRHNVSTRPMGEERASGEQVCRGMIGALETIMDHTEPAWRFRQEHGILDPVAYTIHEPGDTDYWVNLDDEGKSGFDLAVSVLLDVSSSMAGSESDLGIATYGIRRACDDLGIPCTVTTFSDDAEMLWEATEDVTPVIPSVQGSTHPINALRALDDQRYGKARHLVVILTDGVWAGDLNLGRWRGNGRYIMVAGIGSDYLLDYLNQRNPDYAIAITGPMDLPREVTKALIPFIS